MRDSRLLRNLPIWITGAKKELTGAIRIVSIPGGDTCACCGTHVKTTGEIGLVKFLTMIHYKGGVRISLLCGEAAVMDYEKKREELQKISVLLSAKAGKTADAVEKVKNELTMTQAKCSEMSRKLMKIYADQLNGGNSKICWIEDGLDMTELRHFVNFALEGKKGGIVLALSESVNGGFSYVLGSQSEDMRALSKELNGELSGRGGGSSQMAQGTFFARKEELLSSLAARGFGMGRPAAGETCRCLLARWGQLYCDLLSSPEPCTGSGAWNLHRCEW